MVDLDKKYINLYKRTKYKHEEELIKDEKLLQKSLDSCKVKTSKSMYLPLAIHLMEERKKIIGLTFWERVQLKTLKSQARVFKKLFVKWGVPYE